MAKLVVKYLLEGVGTVPVAIQDGGYWLVGHEMIGVTYDNSQRYVSASFAAMSKADVLARVQTCLKDANGNYLNDQVGNPYTDQRASDMCDAWLAQVGMSDLAQSFFSSSGWAVIKKRSSPFSIRAVVVMVDMPLAEAYA